MSVMYLEERDCLQPKLEISNKSADCADFAKCVYIPKPSSYVNVSSPGIQSMGTSVNATNHYNRDSYLQYLIFESTRRK